MSKRDLRKLVVCVFVALALSSIAALGAGEDYAWIRVDGAKMVTSPGAPSPNAEFIPIGMSNRDEHDAEKYIRFCRDNEFNTVRLRFNTNNKGNEWDMDAEVERLRSWVDLARVNGLYTILDNHDFFGHQGITFWDSTEYERWRVNWEKVATMFKDDPWVLGYEIQNEVFRNTMTEAELTAILLSGVERIRAIDSAHIIFINDCLSCGGTFWGGTFDPADFDVIDPPQIVLTPHVYPGTGNGIVGEMCQRRAQHNVPVVVTEFCGGIMGNGFTYDINKGWLRAFMAGVDSCGIGWTIYDYRASYTDTFPTVYSPDDPEIWAPVARKMSTRSTVPHNDTPDSLDAYCRDQWFAGMACGDTLNIEVRTLDSMGAVVTSCNASLTASVTSPGSIANAPSSLDRGAATITVRAGDAEGTAVLTLSAAGVPGMAQVSIPVVKAFDNVRFDSTVGDDAVVCSLEVQHPGKGINTHSVGYEYTNDGGATWVYWDADLSDEFSGTALDTGLWTAEAHNTTAGFASVDNGMLSIRAEGEDVWSTWTESWWTEASFGKDEFYYVHQKIDSGFEVTTKIVKQDNTDPWALAGILVRDRMIDDHLNGYCYVAVTPENGFVFAWKDQGHTLNGTYSGNREAFRYIDAREVVGKTTYPCYLKLRKTRHPAYYEGEKPGYHRHHHIFTAYYSTDGVHWTKIKDRFIQPTGVAQRVGLFACSGVSGQLGEVQFDFFRGGARAACLDTAQYTVGRATYVTKPIPIVDTTLSQKVRFNALTVIPKMDYMNNPGLKLTSEVYRIVDGEDASVTPRHVQTVPGRLEIQCVGNTLRIRYNLDPGKHLNPNVTIRDLRGRVVWEHRLPYGKTAGSLLVERNTAASLPGGIYVVRLGTDPALQSVVWFMPN